MSQCLRTTADFCVCVCVCFCPPLKFHFHALIYAFTNLLVWSPSSKHELNGLCTSMLGGVKFCLAPEQQQDALPAGFLALWWMEVFFSQMHIWHLDGLCLGIDWIVKNQRISVQVHSTELQNKSRRLLRVFGSEWRVLGRSERSEVRVKRHML